MKLPKMAIWYITWGVLAYVMTLGKSNRQARDWVFTGQIVMLAAEVAIVTTPGGNGVLPSWLFPHMAEYEVCVLCMCPFCQHLPRSPADQ